MSSKVNMSAPERRALTEMLRWSIAARKGGYCYQPNETDAPLGVLEKLARKMGLDPNRIHPRDDR
jgi:hypothetical protein